MGRAESWLDRFSLAPVAWFVRLYGLALLLEVASEVSGGVWDVHAGRLYPWRHLGIVPLYPPAVLAVEWLLTVIAAGTLVVTPLGRRAWAWRALVPVLLVACLERYSNHRALFFLVALFVSMAPPAAPDRARFEREGHPGLGLARAQLVLVYVFAALSKIAHGFLSGATLTNVATTVGRSGIPRLDPGPARLLAWVVVVAELALPVVLVRAPRAGVPAVALLQLAFALALPGVASFGLLMVALAVLFLGPSESPPGA